MSIARLQKEENAQRLRDELSGIPHAILVDFKGLNVEEATELRRKLRDGEARFKVVKNSTMLRAVENLPLAELDDALVGQTAIAYTEGDAVNLAKVLTEFAKDFETPNFKAGIVDGAPISAEQFEQLSTLPPREELIGKLVYLMAYPMTGLVTALNGILQGFAIVLEQIRAQKEEAGEAEPQAAEAVEEQPAEEAETGASDESAEAAEAAASEEPAEEVQAPAEEAEATSEEEAAAEAAAEEPAEEVAPAEEAEAAGETPAEEVEAAGDESADDAEATADEAPDKAEAAAEEASDEPAGEDEAAGNEDEDEDKA